jgi:hypothetical protein
MNNIFGSIGLVNIDVNSKFNNPLLTPTTYFIRTINGVNRTFIYYDSDVFDDMVVLSASLLIGVDETPWKYHYNTMHDENLGSSGTAWKAIEDIAIPIYPVPKRTHIEGLRRMDVNTTHNYNIPNDYDINDLFTYDWYILGDGANFGSGTSGSTIILDGDKNVDITFNIIDTITLKCKISNPSGCYRWIIRKLYPGTLVKKLMVVRYPYF